MGASRRSEIGGKPQKRQKINIRSQMIQNNSYNTEIYEIDHSMNIFTLLISIYLKLDNNKITKILV